MRKLTEEEALKVLELAGENNEESMKLYCEYTGVSIEELSDPTLMFKTRSMEEVIIHLGNLDFMIDLDGLDRDGNEPETVN